MRSRNSEMPLASANTGELWHPVARSGHGRQGRAMKQTVQVFSLVGPKAGTAKDKRRYRLKWRVDGRDFSRGCPFGSHLGVAGPRFATAGAVR